MVLRKQNDEPESFEKTFNFSIKNRSDKKMWQPDRKLYQSIADSSLRVTPEHQDISQSGQDYASCFPKRQSLN